MKISVWNQEVHVWIPAKTIPEVTKALIEQGLIIRNDEHNGSAPSLDEVNEAFLFASCWVGE